MASKSCYKNKGIEYSYISRAFGGRRLIASKRLCREPVYVYVAARAVDVFVVHVALVLQTELSFHDAQVALKYFRVPPAPVSQHDRRISQASRKNKRAYI